VGEPEDVDWLARKMVEVSKMAKTELEAMVPAVVSTGLSISQRQGTCPSWRICCWIVLGKSGFPAREGLPNGFGTIFPWDVSLRTKMADGLAQIVTLQSGIWTRQLKSTNGLSRRSFCPHWGPLF